MQNGPLFVIRTETAHDIDTRNRKRNEETLFFRSVTASA